MHDRCSDYEYVAGAPYHSPSAMGVLSLIPVFLVLSVLGLLGLKKASIATPMFIPLLVRVVPEKRISRRSKQWLT